jgi:hypothetical protein
LALEAMESRSADTVRLMVGGFAGHGRLRCFDCGGGGCFDR